MGTIKGDLHDIGKNLVGMMLKGANFEIFDLGTNGSVDKFMAAAREHKADIIGISALLTTTMGGMRAVIEAVRAAEDLPQPAGHGRRGGGHQGVRRADRRRRLGTGRRLRRRSWPDARGRSPRRAGGQRRLAASRRRGAARPAARPGTPR